MRCPSVLHKWFSIPDTGRPLNYYDLLGLPILEDQPDTIEAAFRQRVQQLEPHLNSDEQDQAERVFARLREARDCLMDVRQKARYDAKLGSLNRPRSKIPPPSSAPQSPPRETADSRRGALYLAFVGVAAIMLLLGVGAGVVGMLMMTAIDDSTIAVKMPSAPVAKQPPVALQPAKLAAPMNPELESPPTKAPADVAPEAPEPPRAFEPAQERPPPEPMVKTPPPITPAPLSSEQKPVVPTTGVSESANKPAPPDAPESEPEPAPEAVPVVPLPAPPPPPAIDDIQKRAEYVGLVTDMLEAGLCKAPNREQARASFEKAVALCESDPRLHYGYALILHTVQREEARKQLLAAMRQGAHPYPPAWRLLIEMEVKKGIDARLIEALPSFAKRLEESDHNWPDEVAKFEFALFLGRVVGYCQGPGGAMKRFERELASADGSILAALRPASRKAYEMGKVDVASQSEAVEPAASTDTDKSADDELKLESEKQNLNDSEQKLQRKKEEYDEKWNKLKAEFQREIASLEIDYKLHMENASAIQRGMAQITNSITYTLDTVKVLTPIQQAQIESQKASRNLMEIELRNTLRQAYSVGLRAQARITEIARAEAEYQRATGQLVKESSFIAEHRKNMQVQSDRVAKQRSAKQKGGGSLPATPRFSYFSPLDIESEKARILLSYQANK